MEWFKHYSDCRTSLVLQLVIQKTGFEGYGRYWRLLEIANKSFDGENTKIEISTKELRDSLRIRTTDKLRSYIVTIAQLFDSYAVVTEHITTIELPILLDLMEKDFKKARKKRSKKKKEEEIRIEEKEEERAAPKAAEVAPLNSISNPKITTTPDQVGDLWNKTIGLKIQRPFKGMASGKRREQLVVMLGFLPDLASWGEYFDLIAASDFLVSRMKGLNFDWVINPGNYQKVIEGTYSDREGEKKSMIRASEIQSAIASGAQRVAECDNLSEAERDWVRNNGGLIALNKLNDSQLKQLLGAA